MRIHANLLKHLAGKLYETVGYILNRTPTEALGWKTPYERVYGRTPLVSHMQPIGCRAYALNTELRNADKLESRALIGHLVGYVGTNIFRIWLPTTDEILVTRDVIFKPTQFFEGYDGYVTKDVLQEIVTTIAYPPALLDKDYTVEELQLYQQQHGLPINSAADLSVTPTATQLGGVKQARTPPQRAQPIASSPNNQLITPSPSAIDENDTTIVPLPDDDITPYQSDNEDTTLSNSGSILYPDILSIDELDVQQSLQQSELLETEPRSRRRGPTGLTGPLSVPNQGNPPPEGYRRYGETASQDISRNINPSAIIEGKRTRRPPRAFFSIASFVSKLSDESRAYYLSAFTSQILKQQPTENQRIHISQAPPLPKRVNQLNTHPFGPEFRADMAVEWKNLRLKGCFERTTMTRETADAEVLPLMWVFAYKTDEDGYITRFKARLVVRGDLQSPLDDTYAATLAIRNFRALIAIANYFNLKLKQYNVLVAFFNALIN